MYRTHNTPHRSQSRTRHGISLSSKDCYPTGDSTVNIDIYSDHITVSHPKMSMNYSSQGCTSTKRDKITSGGRMWPYTNDLIERRIPLGRRPQKNGYCFKQPNKQPPGISLSLLKEKDHNINQYRSAPKRKSISIEQSRLLPASFLGGGSTETPIKRMNKQNQISKSGISCISHVPRSRIRHLTQY